MKKIIVFIFTLCSLFGVWSASAYELNKDDRIYVGGQSIGIKLNTGVEIIGSYGIYVDGTLYKPWEEAGIKEGDRIISLNNNEVKVTKDLLRALTKSNGKKSTLEYIRNDKVYQTEIKPIFTDDSYSLGLYVKDSVLGVGTLTYYIEEINAYGSLGHAITDKDYYSGQIYEAKVTDIIKPTQTEAGEKRATIDSKVIGTVEKNGNTGVLGKTNSSFNSSGMEALGFKTRDEIRLGDAEIWTCIQGKKVEKFKIKITGLAKQKEKSVKGITFEVVDEELLSKTGGIIQGMSGSPIVQDNKIIGAVTHVLVNNSKKGYGIYLEFMLEDMDVTIAK